MNSDVLSFVETKNLYTIYISHPFIVSTNKQYETFLFLTGAPTEWCASCLESVTTIQGAGLDSGLEPTYHNPELGQDSHELQAL